MFATWFDGFDTYGNLDENILSRGAYDVTLDVKAWNTFPRTGASALSFGGALNSFCGKQMPATTVLFAGIAWRANVTLVDRSGGIILTDSYTNDNPLASDANEAGNGIKLYRTTTNNLRLVSYDTTGVEVLIEESTGSKIVENAYSYVEIYAEVIGATLEYEITLNGNDILMSGSVATTLVDFSWIFLANANFFGGNIFMDDFYYNPTAALGAQRCYTQFVNADIAPQDWALSGGANAWALLDNSTISDLDYIQGDNVGDISAFGLSNLPSATGAINGVRICAALNVEDAGSALSQQKVTIAAVDYLGVEHSLSTSWQYKDDVFDLTGLGVTVADINAATVQLEKTA